MAPLPAFLPASVYSGRQALLAPQELSAILIQYLVQLAAAHLSQQITGAVITIPADFNAAQRDATMQAAQLAGLSNAQLLQGANWHELFFVMHWHKSSSVIHAGATEEYMTRVSDICGVPTSALSKGFNG